MSCPVDTDEKRMARFLLYRRAKNLWEAGGKPEGHAIVLAGDEASEIGCLRYYLKNDGKNTLFVDKDDTGLSVVQEEWRSAQTFVGRLEDALAAQRGEIAFLNLDFCGYMDHKVIECLEVAKYKLAPKGFVAYTFRRDRESPQTPNWEKIYALGKEIVDGNTKFRNLELDSIEYRDTVRFVGYGRFIRDLLGEQFETVYMMGYHSACAMGVLMFQNIPKHLRTPKWRKEFGTNRSGEERGGRIYSIDARDRLRSIAMELTDSIPSKEVASILHLPTTTLAAWQAHKTRGTYRRPTLEDGEA